MIIFIIYYLCQLEIQLKACLFSSNTCSWSRPKDMTVKVNNGDCDGKCWEEIYNWGTVRSPCDGDRGASLMVKENNRWVSLYYPYIIY